MILAGYKFDLPSVVQYVIQSLIIYMIKATPVIQKIITRTFMMFTELFNFIKKNVYHHLFTKWQFLVT